MLVHVVFYAFVFQDVVRVGINGEDIIIALTEVIENQKWGEFEAWLCHYHDSLIQLHEAKAPNLTWGAGLLNAKGVLLIGKDSGNKAISSGSSPTGGRDQCLRAKKWECILVVLYLVYLDFF